MLPGPVFNIELLATARRARYYALRTFYGLVLLLIIWQVYASTFWWRWPAAGGQVSLTEMARFAMSVFAAFVFAQGLAVLALTPVFLSGVISDEKERRTLHYLLASRLSSAEIVLGKLFARLLHVGVFLAVGLPILSLLTLFGGVPPEYVLAIEAGSCTTAFFLGGLSLLVSTHARTVRESLIVVYLLETTWLILPSLSADMVDFLLPAWRPWLRPLIEGLDATNPIVALFEVSRAGLRGPSWIEAFAWMAGLQIVAGLAFVSLSVGRLRPVFKRQMGGDRGAFRGLQRGSLRRLSRRLPCGADPMFWKELHVPRSGGLLRWVARFCFLIGFAYLAYWTVWTGSRAASELLQEGPFPQRWGGARSDFNMLVRVATGFLYVIWGLGLVAAASSSITSERERDTWDSLLTTDLTGPEIVRAKMLGALWGQRGIGALILGLWLLGLLLGALHPFGLIAALGALAIFSWFILALGTRLSLTSRNTTRATSATVSILSVVNGGYLVCFFPFAGSSTAMILLGCTPIVLGYSLVSYPEVLWFLGLQPGPQYGMSQAAEGAGMFVLSVICYGFAAALLNHDATANFDRHTGRHPAGPVPGRDDASPPRGRARLARAHGARSGRRLRLRPFP